MTLGYVPGNLLFNSTARLQDTAGGVRFEKDFPASLCKNFLQHKKKTPGLGQGFFFKQHFGGE